MQKRPWPATPFGLVQTEGEASEQLIEVYQIVTGIERERDSSGLAPSKAAQGRGYELLRSF